MGPIALTTLLITLGSVPSTVVSHAPRTAAVLLIVTPEGFASEAPTSAFLEAASKSFQAETRLSILSTEQAGADDTRLRSCPPETRLGCWLTAVTASRQDLTFLIALAVHPSDQGDRLSTMVLKLEGTTALRGDDRENQLFLEAVRTEPVLVPSGHPESLRTFFQERLIPAIRAKYPERSDLLPFGAIRTTVDPRFEIHLDEPPKLSLTSPQNVVIDQVEPGPHHLRIVRKDDGYEQTKTVSVQGGQTAEVNLDYDELASRDRQLSTAGISLLAAGGVAVAAGTALIVIAASTSHDLTTGCVTRTGSSSACTAGGFVPFGAGADLPALEERSGVLIAPLGVGLAAGGAAWSLGAVSSSPDELWWPLIGGFVLGGASYAALALVGG